VNIKNLAEHILLQCIEDLWDEGERDDGRDFFKGERFHLCAEMAGMSLHDQSTLLNMVSKIMDRTTTAKRKPKKSIGKKTPCFTVRPQKTGGGEEFVIKSHTEDSKDSLAYHPI
jgi:hypothetical protein